MSNFGIGIPTINRADILNPSLKRYENDLQNVPIYIVDNGKQEIYKSSVTKTATPPLQSGGCAILEFTLRTDF